MTKKNKKKKTKKERQKPTSLYPLKPEEALEDLLKIKPSQNERKRK